MKSAAVVVGVGCVGCAGALHVEPSDVIQGISTVLPAFHECETNVTMVHDVESFLTSVDEQHFRQFPELVSELLGKIQKLFHMCNADNSTALGLANGGVVQDFYEYIKNNILKFDEQMLEEMEEMMKVCSFRAPDGARCGQLLGQILKQIIFGDHAPLALESSVERRSFTGGMLKGLLGNSKHFRECGNDVAAIGHAGRTIIKDLLKHDVQAVIGDLGQLLQLLAAAVSGKRDDLDSSFPSLPHPSLPNWVPHRSHKCTAVEPSSGQRQITVPDCTGTGCKANGVDHDCAWCVYDLDKCIGAYGETCHETVSARESQNAACLSPDNATDTTTVAPNNAAATTTVPELPDVTTQSPSNPDSSTTEVPDVTTPAPSGPDGPTPDGPDGPNPGPSPRPTPSPSPSPKPSPSPSPRPDPSPQPLPPIHGGACRAAVGDLKPFLSIFKDGPFGVPKHLKENLLEADEEMINQMENMGKYCTFRHANAGNCGESLGSITRLIFVGLEASEIMV